MMQFIYKLFVSDKELANSLPFLPELAMEQSSTKARKKTLKRFVKFFRKQLFIRKVKKVFSFKKRALPPGHKGDE